jgi:hypothetical protein
MTAKIAFALLWLAVGCRTVVPDPVPTPRAPCVKMCDHMRVLNCEVAQPTPEGTTCEQVCENTEASGIIRLDLACLTAAPNCGAADTCAAPGASSPPAFGAGSGGATRPLT